MGYFWIYFIIGLALSGIYYSWQFVRDLKREEARKQTEQQDFRDSEGTNGWM